MAQACATELEKPPWKHQAPLTPEAPNAVVYNEGYALERDKAAAKARRRFYVALLPFYPFWGLLWSRFKNRVLGPLGLEPGSITKASIVLIFNLFIVESIFVGWLVGGILAYFLGRPELRPVDWVLMLLLGADSAMRFGQALKLDIQHHWGFCEWMWPGKT